MLTPPALLLAATFALLPGFALAAGPPVVLAHPETTPFNGASLAVRDFDATLGPDLSGIDAGNVVIALRQPGGTFAAVQAFAMGATLRAYDPADLDGDGRPDLVAVSNSARTLVSRRNLGGMAFGAAASIALGGAPTALALGDLDGDGHPDAAVTLPDSGRLEVSFADGAGVLQSVQPVAAAGAPWFVAIGDFTGDGHPDLLSASRILTCVVAVMPGDGAGHFGAPIVSNAVLPYRFSIACADLDGDGDLDLAVYHYGGVSWLPNLGGGSFGVEAPTSLPAGSYGSSYDPGRMAIADLDGDGHPDLAIPLRRARSWYDFQVLAVLRNRGDGTFYPPVNHHVGLQPIDAAVADFDGDGALDAAVTTASTNECCVSGMSPAPQFAYLLRGSGHGTFAAHLEFTATAWLPVRRATGPADLVGTSDGSLQHTRNLGFARFDAPDDLGPGTPWRAVDLNGDGEDELIVTSADSAWVRLALGGGAFAPASSIVTGLTPRAVADVDGDGELDLVASDGGLAVKVLPGDGAGGFGAPLDAAFALPSNLGDGLVRAADVNGDGRADLLSAGTWTERVGSHPTESVRAWLRVALRDGSGHFSAPDSFPVETAPSGTFYTTSLASLGVGDFDGDHVLDVALQSGGCGNDVQGWTGSLRGLGGGAFAAFGPGVSAGNSPCGLAVGDLNADGLDDLARTNGNGGLTLRVTVFTAGEGGVMTATAVGNMGDYPDQVAFADMDGDGRLDVITRSARYQSASIRLNATVVSPPVPALLSLVSARFEEGRAVLDWFAAVPAERATVERRAESDDWEALATLVADGSGHFRYQDGALPAAGRVAYRLRWSDVEGEHVTAEAWLELPGAGFALRGAWPNPAASIPVIALELPRAGEVEIEVFDVNGRRRAWQRSGALAAGPQRVAIESSALAPGVYLARVGFAGRRLETRFVVVR